MSEFSDIVMDKKVSIDITFAEATAIINGLRLLQNQISKSINENVKLSSENAQFVLTTFKITKELEDKVFNTVNPIYEELKVMNDINGNIPPDIDEAIPILMGDLASTMMNKPVNTN